MSYYIFAQTTPPSTTPPAGAPVPPSPAPTAAPAPAPATTTSTGTPTNAGAEQTPPSPGGGMLQMLLFMGVIFLIFYLFLIRPQKKQEKERQKMLGAIKKNDRVLTSGGIYGTVFSIKDTEVVLKIDEDTKVRFAKSAVVAVVESSETPAEQETVEKT